MTTDTLKELYPEGRTLYFEGEYGVRYQEGVERFFDAVHDLIDDVTVTVHVPAEKWSTPSW